MKITRIFLFAIVAGAFAAGVRAAEELPDHKLSEWRVGDTVSGEKVDLSKLDGKVVAIEYWGTT